MTGTIAGVMTDVVVHVGVCVELNGLKQQAVLE